MATPEHTDPHGLDVKDLLEREGFGVGDRLSITREETVGFKVEHQVKSTTHTFINGERAGGCDDLRRLFGMAANNPNATT